MAAIPTFSVTDAQNLSAWQALWDAWGERAGYPAGTAPGRPAVSTIVNSASKWAAIQSWIETHCSSYIATKRWNGSAYVDIADGFEDEADGPKPWGWLTPVEGGTRPSLKEYLFGNTGASWTRAVPREFRLLSDTSYVSGIEPIANGHRARCLADGKVYLRAGGTWTSPVAAPPPDAETLYGRVGLGDYLITAIPNEIGRAIKVLRWVSASVWFDDGGMDPDGASTYALEGSGSGADAATAYSNAVTQFNTLVSSPGYDYPYCGASIGLSGFSTVGCYLSSAKCQFHVQETAWSAFARKLELYLRAEPYPSPVDLPGGTAFDDDGTGVKDGVYHRWQAIDVPSGDTDQRDEWFNGTAGLGNVTVPAQPATAPPPSNGRGFRVNDAVVVCRLDVAGGFTYL